MANSKYEFVKNAEVEDKIVYPNLIVVRIGGCDFCRFSKVHEFEKPNDERALNLMNACATSVIEKFPDIVFSYGFSDEYSFVLKKETEFYERRASKILSVLTTFFTSTFVMKWEEFFPQKELRFPPSFQSRVISCASMEVLQSYLAWRQSDCHLENMYNTCLWMLIKSGNTELEAREILKAEIGAEDNLKEKQKHKQNELLFQKFGINYTELPSIFRQGSSIFKTKAEEIVKYNDNGTPVKRLRKKVVLVYSKNIAAGSFWNKHLSLLKELGSFGQDLNKVRSEYLESFQLESKLTLTNWIVIRIDGCHFHRFSEVHEFEKPNDEQALCLMNSCAVAVLEEFNDIVFSYGMSDEYSFVLKKDSEFYQRCASKVISVIVSFFSSMYVMKWKEFFPKKELKYPPYFDGRAVCYPSDTIRDYLAWRQVDCHINNQYNTCFWMLVKSGMSKSKAQHKLEGTQAQEKNELLRQKFNIAYDALPIMFRQGSSVFWDKEEKTVMDDGSAVEKSLKKVVVEHCNIIGSNFWKGHPSILGESTCCLCNLSL